MGVGVVVCLCGLGYSVAIRRWHKEYYAMLSRYMAEGRFAGKDQSIMASVSTGREGGREGWRG